MTSSDNGGGATLLSGQGKGFGGIGCVKLLRYYDTKALRGNSRISKSDLQHVILNCQRQDNTLNIGGSHPVILNLFQDLNKKYRDSSQVLRKNTFLVPYCLSNLVSSKKAAFTLAEVLITLAIIGIVAAMTIPTLISNYQEKATVTRLKETYSMLSQAYQFAVNDYGNTASWKFGIDMYDPNAHIAMANYFKPYLKLSADCVGKSQEYVKEHCAAVPSMSLEKNATAMRLNNGATLYFRIWSPNCDSHYAAIKEATTCGQIIVQTNPMKSNENGKDTFWFYLTTKGIIPVGMDGSYLEFERACNPEIVNPYPSFSYNNNMYACSAWVIYNGNMDYWKCPGELSWNGKHSCDD